MAEQRVTAAGTPGRCALLEGPISESALRGELPHGHAAGFKDRSRGSRRTPYGGW